MSDLEINKTILNCLTKYNPSMVALFGSFARGENTQESDIDILVDFKNPISLLTFINAERELTKQLGVKVDLVSGKSVQNEKLKQYIQKDLKIIYTA